MLIDFTVENFRSIKEAVTLSAVAQNHAAVRTRNSNSRRRFKPDEEIALPYPMPGWKELQLLPVLAIFGANASGKSNLLMALDHLLMFMRHSPPGSRIPGSRFPPFGLDETSSRSPTRLELRVAVYGIVYTYSLWINASRILLERLDHTPPPPKRTRLLFERRWLESENRFTWRNGADFSGPHTQLEASLADDEPFTRLMVERLNVPTVEGLKQWLRARIPGANLRFEDLHQQTAPTFLGEQPEELAWAAEFLRRCDTGIADIQITKVLSASGKEEDKVFVLHDAKEGQVRWPLEQESNGTQRLVGLIPRIRVALGGKALVLVDELGSNIHPNLTRAIVQLFQNPETNPKRAQLIFTSHDNTLQRGQLLRRDQIWFTEKRRDGSTDLFSLSDFRVRNDLTIDKAYLDGRFGAVPILPSDEDLLPAREPAR